MIPKPASSQSGGCGSNMVSQLTVGFFVILLSLGICLKGEFEVGGGRYHPGKQHHSIIVTPHQHPAAFWSVTGGIAMIGLVIMITAIVRFRCKPEEV